MQRKYIIVLVLSFILAGFMAGGFLLPNKSVVVNEVIITQKPEIIYDKLVDLQQWTDWSIWSKKIDATMSFQYTNSDTGALNQQLFWKGNYSGSGSLRITHTIKDAEIHTLLSLQDEKFNLPGIMRLQVINENTTKVTWQNTISYGNNPLKRYMGISVASIVHRDIGACLNGLKNTTDK